jgi:hypothetical protein
LNEDWAAVGRAIASRLEERGMTMTELANQAEVSLTTVRELVHVLNTRRRNPRTLGRISKTLGWPESHLVQVMRNDDSDGADSEAHPDELQRLRREVQELRERVEALEERS